MSGVDLVERLHEPWTQTQSRRVAIERKAADEIVRLREALVQCRDKFREYEAMHLAKIGPKPPEIFYENAWLNVKEDAERKADRNREMADMCDTALRSPLVEGEG